MQKLIIAMVLMCTANITIAQQKHNKALHQLINKIIKAPIHPAEVNTYLLNDKLESNTDFRKPIIFYKQYGIGFLETVIDRYDVMIVKAAQYPNFKNKFIQIKESLNMYDFIINTKEMPEFSVIHDSANRVIKHSRIMIKYEHFEVLSQPLTSIQTKNFATINLSTNLEALNNIVIEYIIFIHSNNSPLLPR